ncbi:MAG TPA: DNA methyltransferase [Thermoflexales bacterium]|nr:DNA methyltransferase [Thermoflexales bacterium]
MIQLDQPPSDFVGGVPRYAAEFWTSKQRQACSLHEVSYRACFKPQLPRFFIERLTQPGDVVYDPFSGRGTTAIEAALLGRRAVANDANPLSAMLAAPRLRPPAPDALRARLSAIPRDFDFGRGEGSPRPDLSMFYHPQTLAELNALRQYLRHRTSAGQEDDLDRWIRMVATNRLTGHSKGFFSVYTLPPNQAVSADSQRKINARLGQTPPYRDTHAIILQKTRQLLRGLSAGQMDNLAGAAMSARFFTGPAAITPQIADGSVALTVTSPPFLDIVQYAKDNWLRCWFNGIDPDAVSITMSRTVADWSAAMLDVLRELHRITRGGGWVAFEVGETRKASVMLDEVIAPLGVAAGFTPRMVLVNTQAFTKTSNIWGVKNNAAGTNTNRVVLFEKT